MTTTIQQRQNTVSNSFPSSEVEARLRRELGKVAAESDVLRGSWEPSLDSLRIVAVLPKLEDLFDFDLRPEKIVRKGGYYSVDEGVESVRNCLHRLWQEHHAKREVS
jgi:hypothetical protein